MSLTAIEIMRQHRKDQVEKNPSSESFSILGGGSFLGTFDITHEEENKDKGNSLMKKTRPFIIVDKRPDGLTERISKITREGDSKEYLFFFEGQDSEGLTVLWLA